MPFMGPAGLAPPGIAHECPYLKPDNKRFAAMSVRPPLYACAILALAAAMLAGCPEGPVLGVTPMALSFTDNETRTLTVSNLGSGALSWSVESKPSWLNLNPSQGSNGADVTAVQVQAVQFGLAAGTHTGEILIESNGGARTVLATVTVASPPTLEIEPLVLDFGGAAVTQTFALRNIGSGTLAWNIAAPPTGFSVSSNSGNTVSGGSETITVTCNRTLLPPGAFSGALTITSNGGNASVALAAVVQALAVSPATLDFGSQLAELPFTIRNSGQTPLNWTIDPLDLPAWTRLTPQQYNGTLAAGAQTSILITVDRTGLPATVTEASVPVTSTGGNESLRLRIQGPNPRLVVSPDEFDFGSVDTTGNITIENPGTGDLEWSIEEGQLSNGNWTPGDVAWLSVDPISGAVAPSGNTASVVTIDRSAVSPNPDTPFTAYLRVGSAHGESHYIAVSQLSLPPSLRVSPEQPIQFKTNYVSKWLGIRNGGLGTVNWRIDASGRPAWLDIIPLDNPLGANGIASGSVTGSVVSPIEFRVNRAGFAPADQDYLWTFEITATDGNGNELEPVTMEVSMNVARVATISVDTGTNNLGVPNIDNHGIHYIPLGTVATTASFYVSNQGTGTLTWQTDNETRPEWVKNITPEQGALEPLESVTITVTVDRTGLPSGDQTHTFELLSNDPVNGRLPVRIEMQTPKQLVIGGRPLKTDLGLYGISATLEIANLGDPGSLLNFQIESNKPWLYFYPETGTSEGTSATIKDWQEVNISVDRAQLDNSGGTATLTVTAYGLNDAGERVIMPEVKPLTMTVTVQAAPLSFEAAIAKLRIPSLVRLVLLMRDIGYRPIDVPNNLLDTYVDKFSVFEKDNPVEVVESGQFLTSGDNLKTNVVILLDYSNSMYEAASKVGDPAIAGAPDPLQALYNRCVGELLDSLPDTYNIALMEFHERHQDSRIITAPDNGPDFTTDKATLLQRLENIAIPDHGATELLPAVEDAALQLATADLVPLRVPFDDAEVKALICITDGRLTTPPGKIKDTTDLLASMRVRYMPVGWGNGVMHEPLARIAAGTGGHYYPTATETYALAPDGTPLTRPVAERLRDWCHEEDSLIMPCDQSLARDLKSQVVFTYVSLLEEAPVRLRIEGSFDNPVDGNECLDEQGVITGSMIQKDLDYFSYTGDTRLGQIALHSDGAAGGNARVRVYADYIPRNLTSFTFRFAAPSDFTVQVAPKEAGGIVSDWNLEEDEEQPGLYTLSMPEGAIPLPYGAYGDLLYMDITGAAAPFTVDFTVVNPVYDGTAFCKYFTCPNGITVDSVKTDAPSFPTPLFLLEGSEESDNTIEFGANDGTRHIAIMNEGGFNDSQDVYLHWVAGELPSYLKLSKSEGVLKGREEVDNLTLTLDRNIEPGEYATSFFIYFDTGTLGMTFTAQIIVTATVLQPSCELTSSDFLPGTQTVNLGPTDESATVNINNSGQGVLTWKVDPATLPAWLEVTPTTGKVIANNSKSILLEVDRSGLAPGGYSCQFQVTSVVDPQTVTVEITVPVAP